MDLFNVYPRFDIQLSAADGVKIYDDKHIAYLDLYGGHGVISIGHNHPNYVNAITHQLSKIGYYSNSVHLPIQQKLAKKLAEHSGYPDYALFLCNSGAEANENALKLASFHTGKKRVIAFHNSFHGRTSAALNVTDNPKLSAELNKENFPVTFLELNNVTQLHTACEQNDICAIIVEGIQGVGGLDLPSEQFLLELRTTCDRIGAVLILDEIQSGFGRSGQFFAHQIADIKPDIVTMAKGMGNGFPVAGLLIHPSIKSSFGLLGTTFGGNPLACAAAIAVLETIAQENLLANVDALNKYFIEALKDLPHLKRIKGLGLMLGLEFDFAIKDLRHRLLFENKIFTGASANPNLLRILPPLTIQPSELEPFVKALKLQLA